MKLFLSLAIIPFICFLSTSVTAQNVGIGVTNPLQRLHVGGNIRIDGIASGGTGLITTNANGDLLRTNFSGNTSHVLRGDGTFGTVAGGLPPGAIVGSADPHNQNLLSAGYSFFGELVTNVINYGTYPGGQSQQFTQAPTYENGNAAKEPAPSARIGSTALSIGNEAIVWGGYYGSINQYIFLNNGSRYDPLKDEWKPLSTVNAPDSRANASAVWSGTEMLVWGGLDSVWFDFFGNYAAFFHNSGGKYNPQTDTWTTMSQVGAPSPRQKAAAVWTGSLMVVWGGATETTAVNTGSSYNPALNSWTAIPTVNAPVADILSTRMFWTGTYALVLGYRDTVARYNPVTRTWLISAKYPAGASYNKNAVVWTGTELWVYEQNLQRIDKYNPATNIWTNTIVSGGVFPEPNFEIKAAVWSGTEMILYGNSRNADNDLLNNRYYRYIPATNQFSGSFNEIFRHNRNVDEEVIFIKTDSCLLKWGGYLSLYDQSEGTTTRFSRQGTRIYLYSGIAIPTIYISNSSNNNLYLYRKD